MSDNTKNVTASAVNTETRYLGRVKWFNNKAGYGFATIISNDESGDRVGQDVFAHHSGIKVDSEQYKYLVQGEYVEFNLRESDSDSHPFQSDNLTGICGGRLMCETRAEQRQQREERDAAEGRQSSDERQPRRRRQRQRPRGSGPRDDGRVWALVDGDGKNSSRSSGASR